MYKWSIIFLLYLTSSWVQKELTFIFAFMKIRTVATYRHFWRRLIEICRHFYRRRTEISRWLNTWRSWKHGWSSIPCEHDGYCVDTCSNISVEFVAIKCAEHDHTLQTVNTEFETSSTSRFSKIVTNTCFHQVYNINTSRTWWKHGHVYRVNRGCPRGHMLLSHWSKNALLRNLPGAVFTSRGEAFLPGGNTIRRITSRNSVFTSNW